MKTHELKCWPHFFEAMERGEKTFEIRRNDRKYVVGDTLKLRKFDPSYGFIPGVEPLLFEVTYVMFDEDFPAIMPGFVIMGLERNAKEAEKAFVKCLNCGAHYQPYYGHIACGVEGTGEDGWKLNEARPIGEIVAELPVMKAVERCNGYREIAGLPYSKASPCPACLDGLCQFATADGFKA